MSEILPDSVRTRRLLENLRAGDRSALGHLLARHRPDVSAFVECHLDVRLRARLDPSDVVQEAQMEAARRVDEFLQQRPMPFHVWIRKLAYQRLLNARRDHLRRAKRAVDREVRLPDRSSLLLARPLVARGPTPSQHLEAREFADRVGRAVADLGDADRELLVMRHADRLPYDEIALLLEIEPAAARKRYGRALLRLRTVLRDHGLLGTSQ